MSRLSFVVGKGYRNCEVFGKQPCADQLVPRDARLCRCRIKEQADSQSDATGQELVCVQPGCSDHDRWVIAEVRQVALHFRHEREHPVLRWVVAVKKNTEGRTQWVKQ